MTEQAIIIEKGIPIPEPGTKTGKWQKILNRMDIGDSCVIDLLPDAIKYARGRQVSTINQAAKSMGMKIKTMRIENQIRVWRIQ